MRLLLFFNFPCFKLDESWERQTEGNRNLSYRTSARKDNIIIRLPPLRVVLWDFVESLATRSERRGSCIIYAYTFLLKQNISADKLSVSLHRARDVRSCSVHPLTSFILILITESIIGEEEKCSCKRFLCGKIMRVTKSRRSSLRHKLWVNESRRAATGAVSNREFSE